MSGGSKIQDPRSKISRVLGSRRVQAIAAALIFAIAAEYGCDACAWIREVLGAAEQVQTAAPVDAGTSGF